MNDKYVLDADGNAQPEADLLKWTEWFETHDRHVADDRIGDVRVSTVFLGLDHSFPFFDGPHGSPVLWETMIFGGEHDQYQQRYHSRDAAIAGHQKALEMVRRSAASA